VRNIVYSRESKYWASMTESEMAGQTPDTEVAATCSACGLERSVTVRAPVDQVCCPVCGLPIVSFRRILGVIYVLSHPRMLGLLKIGFTTRQMSERLAELNGSTSVPGPITIETLFYSDAPQEDEAKIHSRLVSIRTRNREFFETDPDSVVPVCTEICRRQPFYAKPPVSMSIERPAEPPTPLVVSIGKTFHCAKCLRPMKRLAGNRGWACKGCKVFVGRRGTPLTITDIS